MASVFDLPEYPQATWRLLFEPYGRPGALNLAIDEAVARAVAARTAPPTLRLYAWSPPALTLGRGQPAADADAEALRRDGIALLRRMTGGTAVLNRDELAYMAAVTDAEPRLAAPSIAESYRAISVALRQALARLGLTTEAARRTDAMALRRDARSPVCFELPADYEITVGGRKLVGSAQMRIRGGILQHGSLPLRGDMGDISRYLVARPDPARIRSRALTLHDALGRDVTWAAAAAAVRGAFREALALELAPAPLTPWERREVERLMAEKYGDPAWTARV